MDLYREEVMDHYEHPRNQGEIEVEPSASSGQVHSTSSGQVHSASSGQVHSEKSGQVLTGRDSNASCGDMIQFYLRVDEEARTREHVIVDVKWKGIGCAITTAAASKLSEYLQGRTLKELRSMSEGEMVKKGIGFEVNPGRMKCLTLPVVVVKKLIS